MVALVVSGATFFNPPLPLCRTFLHPQAKLSKLISVGAHSTL
jgi:hypothetical protein